MTKCTPNKGSAIPPRPAGIIINYQNEMASPAFIPLNELDQKIRECVESIAATSEILKKLIEQRDGNGSL